MKAGEKAGVSNPEVFLDHPSDLKLGDYSCNLAMKSCKSLGMNPMDLAQKIVDEAAKIKIPEVARFEIARPGFINIFLDRKFFVQNIDEIIKEGKNFGSSEIGKNKTILFEFSSPNIAKSFTIGHFRSTIIGDSISKILEFSGFKIIKDNHLGDWGSSFGKIMSAIKHWSDLDKIAKSENPINELVNIYVRFNTEAKNDIGLAEDGKLWFWKLEHKDPDAIEMWKKCVELSMTEFDRIYKKLGVTFDTSLGESFYEDKMAGVLEDVKKAGIAKESEGAYLIFYPEDKLPPLMLLKSDGASLYSLRDLTTDKWRKKEYGKDIIIINEVGIEQSQYFKQLFEAEVMLGYVKPGERVHVAHGLYVMPGEGKMSTRKGGTAGLDDLIIEAEKRVESISKENSEIIAMGAIKFNDLKRASAQDVIFDWNEMLNLKGDSGPYIQYSFARGKSLLEKSESLGIKSDTSIFPEEIFELERILYRLPEIVERSAVEYSPSHIASYLINLAGAFNAFYAKEKVADTTEKYASYKTALVKATTIVLENSLRLLGISCPDKM